MLATIHGWLDESLAGVAFVAVEADGIVGFVTVAERKHFTGVAEAYVGELAVAEDAEGRRVGRALMEAVEAWACDPGSRACLAGHRHRERRRPRLLRRPRI